MLMAKTIKICAHCGQEFESGARNVKFCVACRKEWQRIDNLNRYYRKKGIDKHINFEVRDFTEPSKNEPMFKFEGHKTRCSFDGCPFKSGNKPCLFYFEYKDGTQSCPGKRFMKGSDKIGLEKRSD